MPYTYRNLNDLPASAEVSDRSSCLLDIRGLEIPIQRFLRQTLNDLASVGEIPATSYHMENPVFSGDEDRDVALKYLDAYNQQSYWGKILKPILHEADLARGRAHDANAHRHRESIAFS